MWPCYQRAMITSSPGRRFARAGVLTATLISLAVTDPASAQVSSGSVGAAHSPAVRFASHELTLITGDRVTVTEDPSGNQSITVAPAPGREDIAFVKRKGPDGWSVIPADALASVAAERLDQRLFNVSALVGQKHTGASGLPLIVEYGGEARTAVTRHAEGAGTVRPIQGSAFATVTQRPADAGEFWKDVAPAAGAGPSVAGCATYGWTAPPRSRRTGRRRATEAGTPGRSWTRRLRTSARPRPGPGATTEAGSRSPSWTAATTRTTRI